MSAAQETELFYFSGTGNSLLATRELAGRLGAPKITPIISCLSEDHLESKAETIGIIFPAHALTIPLAVRQFIIRSNFPRAEYCFSLATRLGTEFYGHREIARLLRKKGLTLGSNFTLNMYSNDSRHQGFVVPSTETLQRLKKTTASRIEGIAAVVKTRAALPIMDSDVLSPTSKTKAGKMAIKTIVLAGMRLAAKTGGVQYFYHDEKCNNCGICAKVCLSGKVKMTPSEPAWKRDVGCLMCFACLNYCPRHAVQIKSIPGVKSFTQSNGRYPHPFATLADIMGQKSLEALP